MYLFICLESTMWFFRQVTSFAAIFSFHYTLKYFMWQYILHTDYVRAPFSLRNIRFLFNESILGFFNPMNDFLTLLKYSASLEPVIVWITLFTDSAFFLGFNQLATWNPNYHCTNNFFFLVESSYASYKGCRRGACRHRSATFIRRSKYWGDR